MSQHYLNTLFAPKSVAIIGASERPDSAGQIVFQNMLQGGYKGALYPVNAKSAQIQGQPAYPSISSIGKPVELAVIATPPQTVPGINGELRRRTRCLHLPQPRFLPASDSGLARQTRRRVRPTRSISTSTRNHDVMTTASEIYRKGVAQSRRVQPARSVPEPIQKTAGNPS